MLEGDPSLLTQVEDTTQRWRQDAWLFLETPSSSWAASVFMLASTIIILYSTIMFCAETVHGVYSPDRSTSSWLFVSEVRHVTQLANNANIQPHLCSPQQGPVPHSLACDDDNAWSGCCFLARRCALRFSRWKLCCGCCAAQTWETTSLTQQTSSTYAPSSPST